MDHFHAALSYARRGCHLFPLHGIVKRRCTCGRRNCSSPGEHPLIPRGSTKRRRIDAVEEWWSRWPLANIGIATGSKSGIVVIDVDLPRALDSLEKLGHNVPRHAYGTDGRRWVAPYL